MLIDEIDITIIAGHGGAGRVSFSRTGPDGGNGGKGGDIYVVGTSDLRALNQFSMKKDIKGIDGVGGSKNRSNGKNAKDIEINIPVGCVMTNKETGEVIEITTPGQTELICKGGLGGWGNFEFKSGTNRSPDYAQPGLPGEEKTYHIELKFLADYGLIGLPNAGKSSLLNELTNAHAAVGDYAFTTLEANLGVLNKKIIADIPGLIEGASTGKGLGIKFLKHIEKVQLLLHCITADSADVIADYEVINKELEAFSPDLVKKPRVIIITKTDLISKGEIETKRQTLEQFGYPIYEISILIPETIDKLKRLIN